LKERLNMAEQELKPQMKAEGPAKAERVRPGRVFIPTVDIFETPQNLVLVADMPGVPGDAVSIDLKENLLVISGEVAPPRANESLLVQEYALGDYYREFQVGELIDKDRIEAGMKDGVLRLVLPKAEKAKPRKIEVKSA
jgi:HSP20 family protein